MSQNLDGDTETNTAPFEAERWRTLAHRSPFYPAVSDLTVTAASNSGGTVPVRSSETAMWVFRVVKWAGVLIVGVIVAAIAIILTVDVNNYREDIAAGFKNYTGRDLSIEGEIDLSLSFNPAVVVEDITVANAGWGSRPEMVTIRRAEAEVELIPLIMGDVRVNSLVLVEPDIFLEIDGNGEPNWLFGATLTGDSVPNGGQAGIGQPAEIEDIDPVTASGIPIFNHVEIRDGRLTFRNGKTGEAMHFDLAEVAVNTVSKTAPVTFEVMGTWNQAPFSASGSIEPLASIASGQPLLLAGEFNAFGFDVGFRGKVADPHGLDGLDLKVEALGANLASVTPLTGPGLPKLGPVNLETGIRGSIDELDFDNLRMTLASSDAAGAMTLSRTGDRPRFKGTLTSTNLDLTELLSGLEGGHVAKLGEVQGTEAARHGRIFPDDPLPLAALAAVDLDLDLFVGRLATTPFPLEEVKARILLDHGTMTVQPLTATVAQSRITGRLRLDAGLDVPSLNVAIEAPKLDLGRVLEEADVSDLFEGEANIRAVLSGTGTSIAALLSGLNGDIRLLAEDGRLKTQALDAWVGGASAVLGTLFPGREQWTVVNCAASSITIEDGIATSQGTLIDTEYAIVAAVGKVDLATETLDLVFEPKPKSVTLNVAVPVHVQGSLAHPTFRPDPGATLKKLGGLLGLSIFPPAALAGLGELGTGDNECVEIAVSNRNTVSVSQTEAPLSGITESVVEGLTEDAEELVDDLLGGLKGLLGKDD